MKNEKTDRAALLKLKEQILEGNTKLALLRTKIATQEEELVALEEKNKQLLAAINEEIM